MLRQKSKVLIAFGSCSHLGGIPGLANLFNKESILERVFDTVPSLDDSRGTRPKPSNQVPEGEIQLPVLYDQVKTLAQTVEVDYYMPGCPPVVNQVWNVLQLILQGKMPKKGSVVGVNDKTVCDVCPREKGSSGIRIKEFKRPHEVDLDPDVCFLTQGVICCGPVTRAGCGIPCLNGNMPCRGCYGPPDGVEDQGTKLISAIAALIDTDDPEELQRIVNTIVDPVGTFYRFSLPDSILSDLKFNKPK